MAKNSIRDFDNTAGNNTDIQSVDIAENCAPSGINNAIRELMADMADVNDGTVALVSPAMDSADINGGTIDGTVIGGTTPAAGTFTTGDFNTSLNVDGTITSDGLTVENTGSASTLTLTKTDGSAFTAIAGNYSILGTDDATNLYFKTDGSFRQNIASNGDISFYEDTGTTPKLFWDASAEALGIGKTPNSYTKLDVKGLVGFEATNSTNAWLAYTHTDNTFRLNYNGAGNDEVIIDSSGNLLVGKMSDSFGTAGAAYRANGSIAATASANEVLDLNRLSTDGNIMRFFKDGSSVGSIGTASGDLHIDGLANHSGIRFQASSLIPRLNGSDTDNTIDLGYHVDGVATHRFKDLHLGGVLYMNVDSGAGSPDIKLQRTDTSVGSGNQIGSLQFWAGEDGSEEKVAAVRAVADDAYSSSSSATRLVFETTTSGSTSATEKARLDSAGNLLVGTTDTTLYNNTSGEGFSVVNSELGVAKSDTCAYFNRMGSNGTTVKFFNRGGNVGDISTTSTSTSYNTSSDYRLKENITDITDGIERVKQLNPSRFNFIADADTTVDGFLAHQVSDIVPEAVSGEKDAMRDEEYEVTPAVLDDDGNVVTEAVMGTRSVPDYQGIDQSKLVPLLTAALQEAIAKIETLEAKVTALENA